MLLLIISSIYADDPERNTEFNYKDMKRRDRRRWERADVDKDDKLTKEELTSFLHPEEIDHMKDIMVEETLEDIDKDKDGKVSLDEYIGEHFVCMIHDPLNFKSAQWPTYCNFKSATLVKCMRLGIVMHLGITRPEKKICFYSGIYSNLTNLKFFLQPDFFLSTWCI